MGDSSGGGVVRLPCVAGRFYPATAAACRERIRAAREERRSAHAAGGRVVAGVAPHAGWPFCGATIASTVDAIAPADDPPDTVIWFGAVHVRGCEVSSVYPAGAWQTPLGEADVDGELAAALAAGCGQDAAADADIHRQEHSIEVQLPFVQAMLPAGVRIVPVMVPPGPRARRIGEAAADACDRLGRRAVAVGSSDLTHYGRDAYGWAPKGRGPAALAWVRDENDRRMIDRMIDMDAEGIVPEARERRNACGPGAVAATIAFAAARGATRGVLLDYTTSFDEDPRRNEATDFVGYASVAFSG